MNFAAFTNYVESVVAPHAHRITIEKVWGGARARIDGHVVCNRATAEDAREFAVCALYTKIMQEQTLEMARQYAAWVAQQNALRAAALPSVPGWQN